MPWDNLDRGLISRLEYCATERQARERALRYEHWARHVVGDCLDDLARDVAERIASFDERVQRKLEVKTIHLQHAPVEAPPGVRRTLCITLELDQVDIHGQWRPGGAPTVHLLWSRRRQGRYCQMVPIAGGRLLPRQHHVSVQDSADGIPLVGYRILSGEASSDETTREELLFRALRLLACGTR